MLHFKYAPSEWIITATLLPNIPLSSFQGGQRLLRPRSLYNLSLYQLQYKEIFIEMLDILDNLLIEEDGCMRGWYVYHNLSFILLKRYLFSPPFLQLSDFNSFYFRSTRVCT